MNLISMFNLIIAFVFQVVNSQPDKEIPGCSNWTDEETRQQHQQRERNEDQNQVPNQNHWRPWIREEVRQPQFSLQIPQQSERENNQHQIIY